MKFHQLIKFIKTNIFFFKHYAENATGRLVSGLFLLFEKALYEAKASGQHLSFQTIGRPRLGPTIKTNCATLQTADPELIVQNICSIFIF